ncbi:MAG TPA: hypothetical protein VG742_02910 [Dongiaceae bacterium]|nr:hypothetical protein [Dongiaceae bacterium]
MGIRARRGTATNVTLPPPTQTDLLILLLNQKINTLFQARRNIVALLSSGAMPLARGRTLLRDIDAEINRCLVTIATLRARQRVIRFPSPAQISALRGAVEALGQITIQGATTVQLVAAVTALINTYP